MFCRYYADSGNAEQSAIQAGYSKSTARASSYKLLAIDGVKDKIEGIREANLDISTATIERKKQHLLDIAFDRNTKPAESIKALHEHSLMCGDHAAAKLDINGIGEPRIIFAPHPSILINQYQAKELPEGMPIAVVE